MDSTAALSSATAVEGSGGPTDAPTMVSDAANPSASGASEAVAEATGNEAASPEEGHERELKKRSPFNETIEAEILRQVEYYFSDSNLARDKFMMEKIEEGDGYVSLPLLCTFRRMQRHLGLQKPEEEEEGPVKATPAPPHLVEAVANVLRRSVFLGVSPDGTKVRRLDALLGGPEQVAQMNARSLFASPFPFDTEIHDVHGFFSKYGTVRSVTLRRYAVSKVFRGSVFVEMGSDEEMQRVVGQQGLICNGVELQLETKMAFVERVKGERLEGPRGSKDEDEQFVGGKQGAEVGAKRREGPGWGPEELEEYAAGRPSGLVLAFQLEKAGGATGDAGKAEGKAVGGSTDGDVTGAGEVAGEEAAKTTAAATADGAAAEESAADDGAAAAKEAASASSDGAVAKEAAGATSDGALAEDPNNAAPASVGAEGEEGAEEDSAEAGADAAQAAGREEGGARWQNKAPWAGGVTRDNIRSVFEKFGAVKFVEYNAGAVNGYVRFAFVDDCKRALARTGQDSTEEPISLNGGFVLRSRPLEGEEEKQYWARLRSGLMDQHGGGRWGGRRGRGGGRGRYGGSWRGRGGARQGGRGRGGRGGRGGEGGAWRGGGHGGGGGHFRFDD